MKQIAIIIILLSSTMGWAQNKQKLGIIDYVSRKTLYIVDTVTVEDVCVFPYDSLVVEGNHDVIYYHQDEMLILTNASLEPGIENIYHIYFEDGKRKMRKYELVDRIWFRSWDK